MTQIEIRNNKTGDPYSWDLFLDEVQRGFMYVSGDGGFNVSLADRSQSEPPSLTETIVSIFRRPHPKTMKEAIIEAMRIREGELEIIIAPGTTKSGLPGYQPLTRLLDKFEPQ
jgi:hypothetical protein